MDAPETKTALDRELLATAEQAGPAARLAAYLKLSGPGWLQSALTLGGGSLGSSLYLGILGGASLLWLQPLAMALGVVMLGAISYVTLSTGRRPFEAINEHVSPVLGWSWLAATLLANMIWALPQYTLCFAVIEQNLLPGAFQGDAPLAPRPDGSYPGKWVVTFILLAACTLATWSYGGGGRGRKIYDGLLKAIVAVIVACFIAVVVKLALSGDGVEWSAVAAGFVPDLSQFTQPARTFAGLLDAIDSAAARQFWIDHIVSEQRDVMIGAGSAAVGVNMTFLLPYSLLSRGWDRTFRGFSLFDLVTGMFLPFTLTTCCIIVAAAQQFHVQMPDGFLAADGVVTPPPRFAAQFDELLARRDAAVASSPGGSAGDVTPAERRLAAVLVRRDAYDLSQSLEKLFASGGGTSAHFVANVIFGVGVAGMTLSSISLMMLISGFVVCEALGRPPQGWTFRLGCLASATGALWPLAWQGGAKAWLTVLAGVFGAILLPVAYVTFLLMMNNRALMRDDMPRGWRRWAWNVLMTVAVLAATTSGLTAVVKKTGALGATLAAGYALFAVVAQAVLKSRRRMRQSPPL